MSLHGCHYQNHIERTVIDVRLIDADVLYERLKVDEELARDRVIDTPNSFPNGTVNPSAIRYMAQLSERTRFKRMVLDAPTIEERKKGEWINITNDESLDEEYECSVCGYELFYSNPTKFCPNCGADMRGNE